MTGQRPRETGAFSSPRRRGAFDPADENHGIVFAWQLDWSGLWESYKSLASVAWPITAVLAFLNLGDRLKAQAKRGYEVGTVTLDNLPKARREGWKPLVKRRGLRRFHVWRVSSSGDSPLVMRRRKRTGRPEA